MPNMSIPLTSSGKHTWDAFAYTDLPALLKYILPHLI